MSWIVPPHYHLSSFKDILGAPRGHSEVILGVDPRESVVTPHTAHLIVSVSTPTCNEEIYLLRSYRPTLGVAVVRATTRII